MQDFLFAPEDGCHILMGSVGWDDADDYYFVGDEDENDGHTLVRVQLFEGRDHTKPLASRAQGHKIVCHINSLAGLRVPPKDSRVYVAIPKGMEHVTGAGVIFACIERTPSRAGNINPDETVVVGPDGSEGRVIFKTDGTVSLITSAGNEKGGKSVVFTVSPDGLKFSSPYGSIRFDVTGFHVLTKYGPRIDMGGMNIPGMPSEISGALTGYCTITAPVVRNKAGIVFLGIGPVYQDAISAQSTAYAIPMPVTSGPLYQSSSVRVSMP